MKFDLTAIPKDPLRFYFLPGYKLLFNWTAIIVISKFDTYTLSDY